PIGTTGMISLTFHHPFLYGMSKYTAFSFLDRTSPSTIQSQYKNFVHTAAQFFGNLRQRHSSRPHFLEQRHLIFFPHEVHVLACNVYHTLCLLTMVSCTCRFHSRSYCMRASMIPSRISLNVALGTLFLISCADGNFPVSNTRRLMKLYTGHKFMFSPPRIVESSL